MSIIRGVLFESVAKGVLVLSGFILNIYLARKLGPSEYGIIGIITSILFFFELFLTNGIRQAVSKILSSSPDVDEKKLWKKALFFQMILSSVLIFIGILLVNFITRYLKIEQYKKYLFFLYALIPLKAVFFLSLGFLNGKLLFKKHAITNIIYSLSRLIFAVIILILTGNGIFSILSGTAIGYLLSFFYIRKNISLQEGNGAPFSFHNLINITISALGFYLLVNLLLNIDILLLRGYGTKENMIGIYKANASIGIVLYYFYASILQVTYPSIAKNYSQNRIDSLKNLVHALFLIIFFLTSIAFLFTKFYSNTIITLLFGHNYFYDNRILPLYVIGIGLLSLLILLGNLLIALEVKKIYLIYLFGSLCFFVFSAYFLYDYLYILSPPVALSISSTITILIFICILNKKGDEIFYIKKLILVLSLLIILATTIIKIFDILQNENSSFLLGIILLTTYALISIALIKDIRIFIGESITNLIKEYK